MTTILVRQAESTVTEQYTSEIVLMITKMSVLLTLSLSISFGAVAGSSGGTEWMKMSKAHRLGYVHGYVAGHDDATVLVIKIIASKNWTPEVSKSLQIVNDRFSCAYDKSTMQLSAVVTKYIENNPERWHKNIGNLVAVSLANWCQTLSESN